MYFHFIYFDKDTAGMAAACDTGHRQKRGFYGCGRFHGSLRGYIYNTVQPGKLDQ